MNLSQSQYTLVFFEDSAVVLVEFAMGTFSLIVGLDFLPGRYSLHQLSRLSSMIHSSLDFGIVGDGLKKPIVCFVCDVSVVTNAMKMKEAGRGRLKTSLSL